MINKQNLWFLTLFSLILVLSIFYFTIGDNNLSDIVSKEGSPVVKIDTNESDILAALRVSLDEERLEEMATLQEVLLSEEVSMEEKNNAYDTLKELNLNKGKEEKIETIIKEKHNLESFVKISNDQIKIVIAKSDHNEELANNIIRTVQEQYDKQMYITVKFN